MAYTFAYMGAYELFGMSLEQYAEWSAEDKCTEHRATSSKIYCLATI